MKGTTIEERELIANLARLENDELSELGYNMGYIATSTTNVNNSKGSTVSNHNNNHLNNYPNHRRMSLISNQMTNNTNQTYTSNT